MYQDKKPDYCDDSIFLYYIYEKVTKPDLDLNCITEQCKAILVECLVSSSSFILQFDKI